MENSAILSARQIAATTMFSDRFATPIKWRIKCLLADYETTLCQYRKKECERDIKALIKMGMQDCFW